jgi:hypothetical protein
MKTQIIRNFRFSKGNVGGQVSSYEPLHPRDRGISNKNPMMLLMFLEKQA